MSIAFRMTFCTLVILVMYCSITQAQYIEAESICAGGRAQIVSVDDAREGKAVKCTHAWQPLINLEPSSVPQGDQLVLWVRHIGGAIQLKTIVDGKQKEESWIWSKPESWKWTKVGIFPRTKLENGFLFIRDGGKAEVILDAIYLSADTQSQPDTRPATGAAVVTHIDNVQAAIADNAASNTSQQSLAANAIPYYIKTTLHWDQPIATVTDMHWGIADYGITKDNEGKDPNLNNYLTAAKPALIRVHHAGLADRWTDTQTRTWNAERIKRSFDNLKEGYGDAAIILTIPNWPKWMHDGAVLPTEKHAEFVQLVVELVKLMRDKVHRDIAFWEPTNEREHTYEKAGKLDQLIDLYRAIAKAIKTEDSQAKVGGLALTWPNPQWVKPLLQQAGDDLDFLSWHNYAIGQANISDDVVFSKVDGNVVPNAQAMLNLVDKLMPGRKMPTFLDEYNISWTWETRDKRMGTSVGAIFQAMVALRMAQIGVTGCTVWHAQDNIYGLLDAQGNLRAPAYLFLWARPMLTGQLCKADSNFAKEVEVFPILRNNDQWSILIMNRTMNPVALDGLQIPTSDDAMLYRFEINLQGHKHEKLNDTINKIQMISPMSLTLLTNSPVSQTKFQQWDALQHTP